MSLLEQFDYLISTGIIKIAEEDSHNLYEQNQYREFRKELGSLESKDERIEELEEEIDDLRDELDELQDRIDQLKND